VAAINKNRFEYIDALRVVGAASVISFHYFSNGISNGSVTSIGLTPFSEIAKYGYLGVQLFFVVSGYLILMSTNRSAWEFAKGRVKRIYPLYWMAIILITAITYLPTLSKNQPDFLQILASITMFPTAFDQGWIDGAHWFMLVEIQFYLLIFVLLKLRAGKHLPTIFPIWAIVILIWYVFDLNRFNIWYLYGPFSFICGGAIIYSIKQSGWNLLRVVGLIAAITGGLYSRLGSLDYLSEIRNTQYSATVVTVIVLIIFGLLLLTLLPKISNMHIPGAVFLGAITYPLFLIHGRLGYMALERFATDQNKYLIYSLLIILAISIAYLMLQLDRRIQKTISKI
jgi:peptidoglycan/LPS O-acetylase OafA/YrhL